MLGAKSVLQLRWDSGIMVCCGGFQFQVIKREKKFVLKVASFFFPHFENKTKNLDEVISCTNSCPSVANSNNNKGIVFFSSESSNFTWTKKWLTKVFPYTERSAFAEILKSSESQPLKPRPAGWISYQVKRYFQDDLSRKQVRKYLLLKSKPNQVPNILEDHNSLWILSVKTVSSSLCDVLGC